MKTILLFGLWFASLLLFVARIKELFNGGDNYLDTSLSLLILAVYTAVLEIKFKNKL